MKTINPDHIDPMLMQNYLQSAVAPRPIAWVSTINLKGEVNLAPFSFFNIFGVAPPILIFSPNNRLRDGSTKHTLENVKEVPEAVVHMVSYDQLHQMSLTSSEYTKGTNEFFKAGLKPVKSSLVTPPSIENAAVTMECKVLEVKSLGSEKGRTNLVICQVLLMHVADELLDAKGQIDMLKTDWVARGGGNYYYRGHDVFEVPKPGPDLGVGVDQIPNDVKKLFTGNELGALGLISKIPDRESVVEFKKMNSNTDFVKLSQSLIHQNKIEEAWKALLCIN